MFSTTRTLVLSFRTAFGLPTCKYCYDVLSAHRSQSHLRNYGLHMALRFPTRGITTFPIQKKAKPRKICFDWPSPVEGSKRMAHAGGCDREHSLRGNLDAMYNGRFPETSDSAETPGEGRANEQLRVDATQSERVRISPTGPLRNVPSDETRM